MEKNLNLLKEISGLIISPASLDEILDQLMDISLNAISCDAGSLLMTEEDELLFKVVKGEKKELLEKMRIPIGKGIVGWVAEKGEPLIIPDVNKDERFLKGLADKIDYKTYNILCVPMKAKEKVIGVIELINKFENRTFTKEDTDLLLIIADQAGLVIENCRLKKEEEKRSKELKTLLDIGLVLGSTHQMRTLLNLSMKMAKTAMNAEASSLMLIDDETQELVFEVAEGGKEIKEIRLRIGEGIAGWVAEKAEPLLVADVTKDSRFSGKADEKSGFVTKSILAAPLKAKDKVIGVIEAINKVGKPSFSPDEIGFFMLLANQIALAIENAKLYKYIFGDESTISEEASSADSSGKKPIGEILKEFNLITETQLQKALEVQKRIGRKKKVGEILVEELKALTEDALNCALSHQLNIPYVTLTPEMINIETASLLPYEMLIRHNLIPIMAFDKELNVVMADPLDTKVIEDIKQITGCNVNVSLGSKANILEMIYVIFGPPSEKEILEIPKVKEEDKSGERELFLQIEKALALGANELHFEPKEEAIRVRYRVSGAFLSSEDLSLSIYAGLAFRLKMLCGLDSQTKTYQQGFAEIFQFPGMRFEICLGPVLFGEAALVRIIKKQDEEVKSLSDYGLSEKEVVATKSLFVASNGLIIITGKQHPRRSLSYSILSEISAERKIAVIASSFLFKSPHLLQIQTSLQFTTKDAFKMAMSLSCDIIELLEEPEAQDWEIIANESLERLIVVQASYPSAIDALYDLSDFISVLLGVVECGVQAERFTLTSITIDEEMKAKIRSGFRPS
ncbi:MAG: ATPase, T2SS/T4P/T4SS family [bacterium]|nr:ATPase, T2SS/T4P/T4SS family [bacterium]